MRALFPTTLPSMVLAVLLVACGAGDRTTPPGTSPPETSPPGTSPPATPGELRLVLMDQLGPRWYCDPDMYPVVRGAEQARAIERYAEMVKEADLFGAIAEQLGVDPKVATDAGKLAIYRLWKAGVSIPLDPIGNGYRFDYVAKPQGADPLGTRTAGVIGADRTISVEQRAPAGEPVCPICLARGTTIDTPDGPIAVEDLRLGDPVWTLDREGRRVPGTVIAIGSTVAPADHRVIRMDLADGRSVTASPGHPLGDGRTLGSLSMGAVVDGSPVTRLEWLPYSDRETFDLVASGATGSYFSDRIPLGTTLAPTRS